MPSAERSEQLLVAALLVGAPRSLRLLDPRLRASTGLTTKKKTAAAIETNVIAVGDEGAVAEHGVVDREREVAEVGLADDHRDRWA